MVTRNGVGVFCEHPKQMDEAQVEVSKELVEFKWWRPEELGWVKVEDEKEQAAIDKSCEKKAKQLLAELEEKEGRKWANLHPSPRGGYFSAYSRAGELTVIAVTEAGRYYGLNVELTAGYDVGRNWAECH